MRILEGLKIENCFIFHLQGLKGDGSAPAPELAIVQPHVAYIVQFITVVAQVFGIITRKKCIRICQPL